MNRVEIRKNNILISRKQKYNNNTAPEIVHVITSDTESAYTTQCGNHEILLSSIFNKKLCEINFFTNNESEWEIDFTNHFSNESKFVVFPHRDTTKHRGHSVEIKEIHSLTFLATVLLKISLVRCPK